MIEAMQEYDASPQIDMLAISVNNHPTLGMQLSPEVQQVIPQVLQLIFEMIEEHRASHPFG